MRDNYFHPGANRPYAFILGALLLVIPCGMTSKVSTESDDFLSPACLETIDPPEEERRNSWAPATPTITKRYLLAASTGCDGKIYAIGGMEEDETEAVYPTGTTEVYDPKAHTWAPAASMFTPRSGLAAVTGKDGRIYAIGGDTGEQFTPSDVMEIYSPESNTWESGTSLPTAMGDVNATADPDGNIYVINSEAMVIYKPEEGTWSSAPPMPTPRYRMVVAMGEDGRVYAIGGFGKVGDGQGPVDAVEAYSPEKGKWEKLRRMPGRLGQTAGAAAFNGRIYVFGGSRGTASSWDRSAVVYAYSPDSNTWEKVPSMPVARESHAAAIGPDGRIYIVDGDADGSRITNTVDVYTPDS